MIGFYVTMIRDGIPPKVAYLSGPYDTHADALEMVDTFRRKACDIDPFACFDAFGTTRVEADSLPFGRLDGH